MAYIRLPRHRCPPVFQKVHREGYLFLCEADELDDFYTGMTLFTSLVSVSWVAVSATVLLALAVVQRLFFHRLCGFPGPRLAAVTSLYKTYYEVSRGGEAFYRPRCENRTR